MATQRNEEVSSNQELYAYGLAHLIGFGFRSHVVSASFSRTALNFETDNKTQVSGFTQGTIVICVLLFLTRPIEYLPKCVLSSVILTSIQSLFKLQEFKFLWKTNRSDWGCFVITVIASLTLGIEAGIMIGVAASIVLLIYRHSNPAFVTFGRLP
eukprot:UN34625